MLEDTAKVIGFIVLSPFIVVGVAGSLAWREVMRRSKKCDCGEKVRDRCYCGCWCCEDINCKSCSCGGY